MKSVPSSSTSWRVRGVGAACASSPPWRIRRSFGGFSGPWGVGPRRNGLAPLRPTADPAAAPGCRPPRWAHPPRAGPAGTNGCGSGGGQSSVPGAGRPSARAPHPHCTTAPPLHPLHPCPLTGRSPWRTIPPGKRGRNDAVSRGGGACARGVRGPGLADNGYSVKAPGSGSLHHPVHPSYAPPASEAGTASPCAVAPARELPWRPDRRFGHNSALRPALRPVPAREGDSPSRRMIVPRAERP